MLTLRTISRGRWCGGGPPCPSRRRQLLAPTAARAAGRTGMMVLSVSMMVLSVCMMVLSVSMMVLQLGLSKARGRADLVVTVVVTVVTARRKRRARRLKGKARRERRGRCRRRCRIAAEVSHTQRSSRQGTHGMTEVSHTQRSSRQGMYLTEHSTTHSTQSGGGRPRRRTVVGCLAV